MYNVADFKALLATRDYRAIREAILDSDPEDHDGFGYNPGLRLAWKDGELTIIRARQANLFFAGLRRIFYGPGSFIKDKSCGKLLRTHIIKEILYPAMCGTKTVPVAVAEIEALAESG